MRLGIMGGTFDPIHLGHLFIAREAMAAANLDEMLFLPDGDPPHKRPGAPGVERLAMVRLAMEGLHGFSASDMELRREGTTYTVDTLMELKAEIPERDLFFIVGSDTFKLFPTWKTAWKVAGLCHMLVAPRPGDDLDEIHWFRRKLFADYGLESTLLAQPGPDISSTRVRALAREGKDIAALVPGPVAAYIKAQGLYR